jgi:hypothetical protein
MQTSTVRWLPQAALVTALAATPFLIEWALPEQQLTVEERFELDRAFAELEHLQSRESAPDGSSRGTDRAVLPWDDLEGEER